jgi:hypothetical protein
MWISLQLRTEEEEVVVCTRAQTSELTLLRQQPKEVASLVFNTFRKIFTSSSSSEEEVCRIATRDQYDAEGRVLFPASTDVPCFQEHSTPEQTE